MGFRYFAFTLLLAAAVQAPAQDEVDYKPNIHGAIRSRWEMETNNGESRFQVRYARLTVDGKIAPAIDYFAQTDLCDQGKMKILDVWGRLHLTQSLAIQAGQFRMPFGVESFRSPSNYLFANRSFMGKIMCNYRKVGAKLIYNVPCRLPLLLEAGAFNKGTIATHDEWDKNNGYSYAGKAILTLGRFKLTGGAMTIKPEDSRIYMYDGAVTWENSHILAAAEYMYEHYTDNVHDGAHSYCTYVDYHRPVKIGMFNQWSVQGRFDGITAYWSGLNEAETLDARNRITVGSTLTYRHKTVFADIRLNYEKYFYHRHVDIAQGAGDKIVAELVVRF